MAGAPVRLHALGASREFATAAPGGDACAAPLAGQVWDAALCVFAFLAREPPGFTRCVAQRAPASALARCVRYLLNMRVLTAGVSWRASLLSSWARARALRAWRWRCWAAACC